MPACRSVRMQEYMQNAFLHACRFTLKEKWTVLDPKIKIKDLAKILNGDGKTPETVGVRHAVTAWQPVLTRPTHTHRLLKSRRE